MMKEWILNNSEKIRKCFSYIGKILPTAFVIFLSFAASNRRLNQWQVNILLLAIDSICLAKAICKSRNVEKVSLLVNSCVIAIIALVLNREIYEMVKSASWQYLLWNTVGGVGLFYLIVILRRIFCWTQEQYNEIRLMKQQARKERWESFNKDRIERMNCRRTIILRIKECWIKSREIKNEQKKVKADEKKEISLLRRAVRKLNHVSTLLVEEIKVIDLKKRKDFLENGKVNIDSTVIKNEKERNKIEETYVKTCFHEKKKEKSQTKRIDAERRKWFYKIAAVLGACVIVGFYFALPGIGEQHVFDTIASWPNNVFDLVQMVDIKHNQNTKLYDIQKNENYAVEYENTDIIESFSDAESNNSEDIRRDGETGYEVNETIVGAVTEYTLTYIAVISVLITAFYLIYRMLYMILLKICHEKPAETADENLFAFMEQYATPISVMVIAISVLMVFAGEAQGDGSRLWDEMLRILIVLIVLVVSIDILKLILEQCVDAHSLLRISVEFIFIAVIDCTMGIILSAIAGLRMREVLPSILNLFLPGKKSRLYMQIEGYLDEILLQEADAVLGKYVNKKDKMKKRTSYSVKRSIRGNNNAKRIK